jgi:hypothetical protein
VRHWPARREHEVEGVLYVVQSTFAEDPPSLLSDWTVVRGRVRQEFRVRQRLYSRTELRDLLLSAGFARVRLAGGLDGATPYDESARRLVAVAGVGHESRERHGQGPARGVP